MFFRSGMDGPPCSFGTFVGASVRDIGHALLKQGAARGSLKIVQNLPLDW